MIPSTAMSCFPGFCPAIEACSLDWKNLQPGIDPEENTSSLDSAELSKGAKTVLVENSMGPLERFVQLSCLSLIVILFSTLYTTEKIHLIVNGN